MDTTFIDELASAAPTPGGGGAASYVGAVASALASMVGNLTVGKKTYAAVEDDVRATLERLALLRNKLLALIESDAQAFEPLAASYRMPKATPEEAAAKQAALQLALGPACDVPLVIMRSADVVICATGRARTFGAQFFGPGQTVLDVGINFDTQGNLCGDVDFAEVEPVVAAITPVPGGIGTVTTSVTMAHTVAAAEAALAARTGRR